MYAGAVRIVSEAGRIFLATESARRGAAIAFYTVTSIAPVLLIVLAVAGFFFGREAASGALVAEFRSLLGADAASVLEQIIASAATSKAAGAAASAISIAGLILTASGVFLELEDALNAVWGTQPRQGLFHFARARIASVGLVVVLGFLLMFSLVVDASLKAFSSAIDGPSPFGTDLKLIVSFVVSYGLIVLLFAAIYKTLPAKPLAWKDVIRGAAVTALLVEIGKFLIGLYLGTRAGFSSLGAAGAILAVLFWVYISAQIFLFGAALTKAWTAPAQRS